MIQLVVKVLWCESYAIWRVSPKRYICCVVLWYIQICNESDIHVVKLSETQLLWKVMSVLLCEFDEGICSIPGSCWHKKWCHWQLHRLHSFIANLIKDFTVLGTEWQLVNVNFIQQGPYVLFWMNVSLFLSFSIWRLPDWISDGKYGLLPS